MLGETEKKLLYSLINNADFLHFLQTQNLFLGEFEKILNEVIEANTVYCLSKEEQLNQHLLLSFINDSHFPSDFNFIQQKDRIHMPPSSFNSSETDITYQHRSQKEQLILFKVIKNQKRSKLKISPRSDCIRKKVKSMFHKYIITKLNSLLDQSSESALFKPLPKILSICLNLKENKQWSQLKVRELMTYNDIPHSGLDTINMVHNLSILKKEKSEEVEAYLNTKWKSIFEQFLLSSELSNEIIKMENTDPAYATRFRKLSLSFLKFIER